MKILIATDKFKGSLSAIEAARAISKGLIKSNSECESTIHPMADGGDGSIAIINKYFILKRVEISVSDPLGMKHTSNYYIDKSRAYIELAHATGLVLLDPENRNPLHTSTLGTGEMIVDAIQKGIHEIFLFLGGSSTNDAGIGIAHALGFRFLDEKRQVLNPVGGHLDKIIGIDDKEVVKELNSVHFNILCDVTNPMYGMNGAAYTYGKQKGASRVEIELLDAGLRNFANVLYEYSGKDVSQIEGGGAAGGIAAGLSALCSVTIKKGFETISELTELESKIKAHDIVITGEGQIDNSSLKGKVIDGMAKLCKKHKKDCYVFCGINKLDKTDAEFLGITETFSIMDLAESVEDAMTNAYNYLEVLGQNLKLGE